MNTAQPIGPERTRLLTGQEKQPTSIRNIGTNTVYLDDVTDVTVGSFPLFPGDVASWAAGNPCYAISPDGAIVVLSDSLASTLGLGNVQVSGTVDANLAPGASVGINGAVDVSGSTIDANLAPGASVGISGMAAGTQLKDASGTATQPVVTQVPATFFGSGSDGDVILSSNTTLTGHKQYRNLTLNPGVNLDVNGWVVYVSDTLTFADAASHIHNDGSDGGNAANAVLGGPAPSGSNGSGGGAGVFTAGGNGGNSASGVGNGTTSTSGNIGGPGSTIGTATSTIGGGGGGGGTSGTSPNGLVGGSPGTGGNVPTSTAPLPAIDSSLIRVTQGPGAGGGGSGCGSTTNATSGGGGGSGGGAGTCCVVARRITGPGSITANGGNGGNGGLGIRNTAAQTNGCGGSGGGGGGGGGEALVFYETGTPIVTSLGGIGGAGSVRVVGTSPGSATNGGTGSNGTGGNTFLVPVSVG